jgi:hypothetical protein
MEPVTFHYAVCELPTWQGEVAVEDSPQDCATGLAIPEVKTTKETMGIEGFSRTVRYCYPTLTETGMCLQFQ